MGAEQEPDDYDGQRFFEGLKWAFAFSAAGLAVVWLIIQLVHYLMRR